MAIAAFSNPFAMISQSIVTQVCNALGVKIQFNHIVASDDYKVTELEDLFFYFQFMQPTPAGDFGGTNVNQGAGRLARLISRRLRVYIYTRAGTDVYGDDTIALQGTDPARPVTEPDASPNAPGHLGHFLAEELVLDTLDNWAPLNEDGDRTLTIGPLHWLDDAGPPLRAPENEAGLLRSNLDFEMMYIGAIRNNEPAITYPPPTP